ncbi:MAG: hypothetical protein J5J06_07510 [Phycisphaerae bacterium]|nr:hypothetical protein [Phycisphaerae bacterium]
MKQNRYLRRFRQARADAASRACTLEELSLRDSWLFRRMAARGVFVQVEGDRWYIDAVAAESFLRRRARIMLTLAAVGVLIIIIVMVLLAR